MPYILQAKANSSFCDYGKSMIVPSIHKSDYSSGKSNHSSGVEIKYVFHGRSAQKVICWLKGRVRPDNEYPAGKISSIYYDSPEWDFLYEKINSDYLKSKVRLRWYHEFESGLPLAESFIEIKHKAGLRRKKIREKTGLSGEFLETAALDHPKLMDLPYRLKSEGDMRFRRHLFPVFQVSYHRLRYVEPITGTRISVDYNIHVPKINPRLKLRSNPFKFEQAVLEIKGNVYNLSDLLSYLTVMGCRKQSFSKYQAGYLKLMSNER
jgi:hypothetical protein